MTVGYNAQILWVDLTKGRIEVREPGEEVMRKYIGGAGLAAKILWEETSADTEPFAPENPLIFMTGPLTGVVQQSSRHIVAGLSPLTNIWGRAHSGGSWADKLRRSGFMGVVIKGKARKPVYLRIYNGEAEIGDASSLWGLDTYEVEKRLKGRSEGKVSVATIGRAGERLVRFAAIMNDGKKGRAAARCGLGALMGSKKLKAVVVGGSQENPVFDRTRLKECSKKIYQACPRKKQTDVIEDYVDEIKVAFQNGAVPVKNWQGGVFDPGEKFAESLRGARMGFCSLCPFSDTESMYNDNGERHILWEHWGPVGTSCLIDNVEALQESFSLCQRYGLDCISTGGVVALAMECYEKGLISKKETGGMDLTWGNHQAMVELVKQIGERDGFGRLLGEGVRRAAEQIGGTACEYAIHVKGLELPMHDPRMAAGLAVQYATGSIGATHSEAQLSSYFIEDYLYVNPEEEQGLLDVLQEFGYPARVDRFETKGKGEMVGKMQNFGAVLNSLVVCSFMLEYQRVRPSAFIELLNSVTGWDMDYHECMKTGERICNLTRMFNVRRGISRKDDTLPARILTCKRMAGTNPEYLPHLGAMLSEYYEYKGWSEEGIPTTEKLEELDLQQCLT